MTAIGRRAALSGLNLAILVTIAHAANDAFSNVLPVFLPIMQDRFGLGEAALAGFVALISLSSNVMQAFTGVIGDRWGRRRTAALALILGSLLMSFIAVAPSLPALFLLLAIGGLGSAVFHPSAASLAHGSGRRPSLAMGIFMSGGPVGSALMPVVVLYVIRAFGIGYVPWLAAFGVALGLLLLVLVPPQARAESRGPVKIFDRELFFGPVGLLSLAGILRAAAFISFTNAMPLYLVNVKGLPADDALIGWTLAAFSAAAAIGVLFTGALEQRLGRIRLSAGSMVVAVPLLLLTLLVTPGSALFYVLVAAAGMTTNAAIPLLIVSAQELAPTKVATASGMLMGFTWGVAGVLYIGFGAVQEWLGMTQAMALSFVTLVPAALLALVVMRRHVARRPGEGR